MAVKIRLRRMGQKKAPYYRIVVADSRSKRDTIRKGCLKLYDMCEKLGLNCQRISWDTDTDGLWLGNYKGVDDWIYSKPPEEKESFY